MSTSININEKMKVLVCGAHMSDLPLNHQLTDLSAVIIEKTTTATSYQLYALAGGPPYRPGLVRQSENGCAIDVEVWEIATSALGKFIQNIPEPLGLGKVELESGELVIGFICQPEGIQTAINVSQFGGWRNYLSSLS
jgi:allophanate hydrolase